MEALREHRIAGAGLDVFVYEPIPFDHPLLTCDNVILTPHIGGGTGGARDRQMGDVLANVQRFAAGRTAPAQRSLRRRDGGTAHQINQRNSNSHR